MFTATLTASKICSGKRPTTIASSESRPTGPELPRKCQSGRPLALARFGKLPGRNPEVRKAAWVLPRLPRTPAAADLLLAGSLTFHGRRTIHKIDMPDKRVNKKVKKRLDRSKGSEEETHQRKRLR